MSNNIQQNFIEFLLENNALKFGEFTLKSGRISPYFFNLGMFNSGSGLAKLGEFYANTLIQSGFECDVLFGPAYKGIPLASSTCIKLYEQHQQDTPYCFNRKVKKEYGDGGNLVGAALQGKIIMVDDVISAGTTVRETIELLKNYDATLSGIIIAFDRQERGTGEKTAIQEVAEQYNVPVQSIINLEDVIAYLTTRPDMQDTLKKIHAYQAQYGSILPGQV